MSTELKTIHQILLSQRQVASDNAKSSAGLLTSMAWGHRVEVINDLLLEIEAAGVVWPDNVVELPTS